MQRSQIILLVLCIFVFAGAAAIAYGVFQAVPHLEDEQANLFQAKVFASGHLSVATPSQPGAFFVPFVLDWGEKRFSKYPPGYSLALALGVLTHTPWLVNPILGALALVTTYALGREIFSRPGDNGDQIGLLAAILGAASPMFLGLSGSLLAHSLSMLLLAVFAWAFLRMMHRPDRGIVYGIIGGVALGWAALTRPLTALAFGLPFGAWAAWRIVRQQARIAPYLAMLVTAGAITATLPLYQWALTGDPWANLYAAWWHYDRMGFGPGHGVLPGGHTIQSALRNAYRDSQSLWTDLYGWPALSWILFIPGLLLARDRRDAALLAPLGALAVAYGFYWVRGSGIYGPRYWYEAVPFLWLLSARGLVKVWDWAQTRAIARRAIALGLAVLIALNVAITVPARFAFWRGLYFVTNEPWIAVQQAHLHNALILVRGKLWTDYGAVLWVNSPTLDGDLVFARDQNDKVNAAVIAQYPGRQVYWLEGTQVTPAQ